MDLIVVARGWVTATIMDIIYIMVGELYAILPIKLFHTPNHVEEVGHELIEVKPIEPKDICQERAKRKPNRTIYYGLLRKQK